MLHVIKGIETMLHVIKGGLRRCCMLLRVD